MRHIFISIFITALFATIVQAQSYPRAEVFGGYSFLHIDTQGVTGASLDAECNLIVPDLCPPGTFRVHTGFNGWNAAVQVNVSRWLGVKADLSGHYGKPVTLSADAQSIIEQLGIVGFPPKVNSYSFLFGPVMSQRYERYTIFGHGLFGMNRVSSSIQSQSVAGFDIPGLTLSDTAFAMAFGGGVDYKLATHLYVRGQADYLYTGHDFSGGVSGIAAHQNNLRASAGIVFTFGGTTSHASMQQVATPNIVRSAVLIPTLGLQARTKEGAGAEVVRVNANSVAERIGLREGDVINAVDGRTIGGAGDLSTALSNALPGTKIRIGYMVRGYWQAEVAVVLEH